MKPEYEARFCDIDTKAITTSLKALGAQVFMTRTLMRRVVFTNSDIDSRRGWLRLRDQGGRIYLTYKQVASDTSAIDSVLEAEIEVSDFGTTRRLLEAMGFSAQRYQENYREEWRHENITYDIDTWPGLPTFLEVEGPDEHAVRRAATQLGLNFSQATFGSVDEVYLERLGRDILQEATLVF